MKSRRKRKNKNPIPSFVEEMLNELRKDPATGPLLDFLNAYDQSQYEDPFLPIDVPQNVEIQLQIPPEMYRKLLMLCHPDKHSNSETATEVTKWLLEQREMYGSKS